AAMQLHEKLLVFDEDRKGLISIFIMIFTQITFELFALRYVFSVLKYLLYLYAAFSSIQWNGSASTAIQYGRVKKIKSLTLSELNAYVITSPPEAAEFLCTLEIDNIETSNAWCYISCSKRSRKLQRGFFMFTVPHRYSREELNTPAEAFRI
ncbi:LOW QUALITY PROTEIN: hypothetical protein HID58_023095, partial [Brassica napus]